MDYSQPGSSLPGKFSRQAYWNGLPFSSPEDLPDPGIKPASPALAGGFFITESPGKSTLDRYLVVNLLGYMITLSLAPGETAKLFSEWLCHFHALLLGINVLISPHSHLLLFVLCLVNCYYCVFHLHFSSGFPWWLRR